MIVSQWGMINKIHLVVLWYQVKDTCWF